MKIQTKTVKNKPKKAKKKELTERDLLETNKQFIKTLPSPGANQAMPRGVLICKDDENADENPNEKLFKIDKVKKTKKEIEIASGYTITFRTRNFNEDNCPCVIMRIETLNGLGVNESGRTYGIDNSIYNTYESIIPIKYMDEVCKELSEYIRQKTRW